MSEFHDDVTQVKIEHLSQRLRDAEETIYGNGRPGLKERMTTMENTVKSMVDAAEGVRADTRKAIFAAIGSLAVMAIAFVISLAWNSAKSQDTEKIVRETVRAMAVADKGN